MPDDKQREEIKPEELAEGKSAVEAFKTQIEAMDESSLRTPRKAQLTLMRHVLREQPALAAALGALPTGLFDAAHLAQIKQEVDAIPSLVTALIYTETRVLELRAQTPRDEDQRRLDALRLKGLGVARLMVAAGHLDADTLRQIERGHGRVDHARDAVQLSELLSAKHAVVEPLQAIVSDEAKKLGVAERGELHKLGMAALAAVKAQAGGEDSLAVQERRYAALVALLKQRWDRAARALSYARDEVGAPAQAPPTYTTLQRRG